MIKVAVVDDEQTEREQLRSFFNQFDKEHRKGIQVTEFSSGAAFLQQYDLSYDLICLDIDMPECNGMETARKIRERDDKVMLIFVTNMAQMAIHGYEVHALDFIVKPVQYYSFALKIQSALNMLEHKKQKSIVLNTGEGIHKIITDELYYVEVRGHYLFYHTTDAVYKQKAALHELEEKMEGCAFYKCNQCYLVNMKYVSAVQKDEVRVGAEWLKISRPRKKEFLQALANYMGGMEG